MVRATQIYHFFFLRSIDLRISFHYFYMYSLVRIILLLKCEGKIKEDAMKNRIRLKKAKYLASKTEYFLFVINVKWFHSFISPKPCVGVGQVDWRLSHRPRLEDKLHPQVLLTGSPGGKIRISSARKSGVWYGVFYSIKQGMPRCF